MFAHNSDIVEQSNIRSGKFIKAVAFPGTSFPKTTNPKKCTLTGTKSASESFAAQPHRTDSLHGFICEIRISCWTELKPKHEIIYVNSNRKSRRHIPAVRSAIPAH
jgi:hypothetical protein